MSGKNHPNYINGLCCQKLYCNCGREKDVRSKQCQKCYLKKFIPWNKGLNTKGDLPYCKECGKLLSRHDAKRCKKHEQEHRIGIPRPKHRLLMNKLWLNKSYRDKVLRDIKPNNPEKILIRLLDKTNFQYVGSYKFWINKFNPDFIDKKNKKIIELFGNYWHENTKQKDKIRLETYKKNGYRTLIIWSNELKNLNKVINKIKRFINA